MATARADLILVNVNPAFQSEELGFCLNKVQVKVLIMADSFKKSNYVSILRQALHIGNESHDFRSAKIPSLKHVVLLSNQ
jgi:fatty-acyl-CoA synthase